MKAVKEAVGPGWRSTSARGLLLGVAGLVALCGGCMLIDQDRQEAPPKPPAPSEAFGLVCCWQNHVAFMPDIMHNGDQLAGIAGKVYLFGADGGVPLTGKGNLVVEIFDESSGKPVEQDLLNVDPETFSRSLSRDYIGWNYTVFVPWTHYRPDIHDVSVRCRFEPSKGVKGTVLTSDWKMHLDDENGKIVPGQRQLSMPTAKPIW